MRLTSKWSIATAVGALAFGLNAPWAMAGSGPDNSPVQACKAAVTGRLSSQDYDFLAKAARISLFEVRAGHLAENATQAKFVHEFAEHMIKDHTSINKGLDEIAIQKGAVLPSSLTSEQDAVLARWNGLSGHEFDKAYVEDMVKGHTHAVKEFEEAASNISDPDLRAWAQTALPLLREHLRMAHHLEDMMKMAS